MTFQTQPFYAVRVVVREVGGSVYTRDYVRGQQHIGIDAFGQFALGNMLALVNGDGTPITWEVHAITPATVQENRKYHHTTH